MVKLDLVVGNSVGPSRSDQPLIGKLSLADQLARSLIGQISKGSLKRGEQLPTEAELCKIHGVSRITVRRALDLLQKSDLIDRIAGKGTFVTGRSDIVGWQLDSIQDLIEFTTETRTAAPTILQWKIVKPIPEASQFLGIGRQKAYLMLAVRYLDKKPIHVVEGYLPLSIGGLINAEDLNHSTPLELFETRLNLPPQRVIEEISAGRASKLCAKPLGVEVGDPVILQTLRFHGPSGPLQYFRMWWHSKHFKRRYELTRR